jgi:hypothetical protein
MGQLLSRRRFGGYSFGLLSALLAGGSGALAETRAPQQQGRKPSAPSNAVVPGTGQRVAKGDDDFEDEKFLYYPQHPKSSYNIDKNIRVPGGISQNLKWIEAAKRGTPDVVRRVKTPEGGLEGSQGALLMGTLYSGVPGKLSGEDQQDDLLFNLSQMIGSYIPVGHTPNCTVRVYIPKAEDWEPHYHHSFGYRAGLLGNKPDGKSDEYWPGFFFEQRYGLRNNEKHHFVQTWVRADGWGRDMPGPTFDAGTWATLGMSFTPDGQCHFYGKGGVDDLTAADHLGSYFSYSWRAHTFQTYFFNVMNRDDGRSVSSPWIIDDPMLFVATPPERPITASKVRATVK